MVFRDFDAPVVHTWQVLKICIFQAIVDTLYFVLLFLFYEHLMMHATCGTQYLKNFKIIDHFYSS